ncbi:helix-turn-helix transcriptional regulator [Chitinophaga agrisoli]|uniref:Helix-turn-helix transcriptional regulator n=1 Tax=Chitinophaga agrisoli TaxID=2607653 RepID=A0A5B2VXW2_9BACT|nr:helix-turn-helix transcriptional regulator [Chitinophaga agrisoli]KAA2243006.1 helix-turn-helix transcriptional regulator [Chitinophaga agrisoli]
MIAETIRKLRLERSLTQEYVALELGISQNAYCKIENGQVQLTIDRLQKIAAVLDTSLTALFNYPNTPGPAASPELKDAILLLQDELQAKQKLVEELLGIIKAMQA